MKPEDLDDDVAQLPEAIDALRDFDRSQITAASTNDFDEPEGERRGVSPRR